MWFSTLFYQTNFAFLKLLLRSPSAPPSLTIKIKYEILNCFNLYFCKFWFAEPLFGKVLYSTVFRDNWILRCYVFTLFHHFLAKLRLMWAKKSAPRQPSFYLFWSMGHRWVSTTTLSSAALMLCQVIEFLSYLLLYTTIYSLHRPFWTTEATAWLQ